MMIKDIKNNSTPKSWDNLLPLSSPSQLGVTLGDDKMKLTEWTVSRDEGDVQVITTNPYLPMAELEVADVSMPEYANLIASAPELLEFAKKWIAFRNGEEIDLKELWYMATQAVAKAEGSE